MMTNRNKIIIAIILVAIGIAGRFLPHLWNFTPLVAIGLFAGVYLGRHYAWIVPVVAMLISDLFLGFYSLPIMMSVYGSFALVGLFGYLMRKYKNFEMVLALSISGAVFFFLITNFAVWYWGPWYEKTLTGLVYSYTAGLPFFRNALLGDIIYTLGLFGVYETVLYLRKKNFREIFFITKPSNYLKD